MNALNTLSLIVRLAAVCATKLLPLVLLTLPFVGQAQFAYTTNIQGTIVIAGYTGPGGAVTIPSTITGIPVSGIGTNAFRGCTTLTKVTIPNSVANIDSYAFFSCTNLTSLTIGNGVTRIGDGAFRNLP